MCKSERDKKRRVTISNLSICIQICEPMSSLNMRGNERELCVYVCVCVFVYEKGKERNCEKGGQSQRDLFYVS